MVLIMFGEYKEITDQEGRQGHSLAQGVRRAESKRASDTSAPSIPGPTLPPKRLEIRTQ